jgi:tetratricopeptide (TPR) repeat protein
MRRGWSNDIPGEYAALVETSSHVKSTKVLLWKAYLEIVWLGDLAKSRSTMAEVPADAFVEDMAASARYFVAFWSRDYQQALAAVQAVPRDYMESGASICPTGFMRGVALDRLGRSAAAENEWRSALAATERRIDGDRNNGSLLLGKAILLAVLNDKPAAEQVWRTARELQGESSDWLDDYLAAMLLPPEQEIERLGKYVHNQQGLTTAAVLRLNPYYDHLRDNPRFVALQAEADANPRLSPTAPGRARADDPNPKSVASVDDNSVAQPISGVDSTPTLREISRVLGDRTEIGTFSTLLSAERMKLLDELATRAISETPNNPSAWAVAAEISHYFFSQGVDVSPARLEQLNQRATRALQLAPTSFDARWARAAMLKTLPQDAGVQGEAEAILRQLVKEWPSHRGARAALSTVLSDEGRFAESGEMALQNGMPLMAFWDFWRAGEVERAEAAARLSIATGAGARGQELLAYVQMCGREDLDGALASMEQIPVVDLLDEGLAAQLFKLRVWRHEWKAALEAVQRVPQEWFSSNAYRGPRCLLTGIAHDLAGQHEAALAEWGKALRLVDQRLVEHENDGELLRLKANVLARLGETDKARAVAALETQLSGRPADDLALTLDTAMLLGQREAVTAWLKKALHERGNLDTHPVVRFDPEFAAWRGEPWLKKLLRETLPAGAKPIEEAKGAPLTTTP